MCKISIDQLSYHINNFSVNEIAYAKQLYSKVVQRYPLVKTVLDDNFAKLDLTNQVVDKHAIKMTLAFAHTASFSDDLQDENQLCKMIKSMFVNFTPAIVKNLDRFAGSHCVQYEPIFASSMYAVNVLYDEMNKTYADLFSQKATEFELYVCLEFINFARTLRSILTLISIGDDVHALALLRGAYELLAKLNCANDFTEEYVLFKKINSELQVEKLGGNKLRPEYKEFLKNNAKGNVESFLAYGWVKDKNGRRATSLKDFFDISTNIDLYKIYQISSEFVHEDYVGVAYDYIVFRRYVCNVVAMMLKMFVGFLTTNELPKKQLNTLKTLMNNAEKTPQYSDFVKQLETN